MGTVRFLLAAIVVGFHCQFGVIPQTIGGLAAVEVLLFARINRPVSTALGDASYGVYLSHFLFVQIAINLQLFDPITLTNPHGVSH